MQAAGKVLFAGAAVIVLWKVMAAMFVGLLAMALKVGLVIAAVYLVLKWINGKKTEEMEEMEV